MPFDLAAAYTSPAQRARIISEAWASTNLYCPCCPSDRLEASPNNREAIDFSCPRCSADFQLKSCKSVFGRRIVDGAYSAMTKAIMSGATPNLLTLCYMPSDWRVIDLTLIPRFAFTLSCLEKRPPLSETARRAGWVGCNILLSRIPPDARIIVVRAGKVVPASQVRRKFQLLKPLENSDATQRGWTLDVLNVVRKIGRQYFTLKDVYDYSGDLQKLHPDNKHVRDKIRQQLQLLRDMRLLTFLGQGRYSLDPSEN